MRKIIRCENCKGRMLLGDDAMEYNSDIFCGRDCLLEYVEDNAEEIEIVEAHLDEADE